MNGSPQSPRRAKFGDIRRLEPSHLDRWHALQEQGLPDPFSRDSLQVELRNPLARIHGLFTDGQLRAVFLGWLVVDELQILQVVVASASRKQGLATQLVDHALRRARAAGAVTATLEVRSGNVAARALYERRGFLVDGERRGYYPDGETAVLMRRQLA